MVAFSSLYVYERLAFANNMSNAELDFIRKNKETLFGAADSGVEGYR